MIKEINKDVFLLKMKSIESTKDDIQIGNDLLDTLKFHKKTCVGMAANMIGVPKRIIAFLDKNDYVLMYNPYIIAYLGNYYETMEGCLSLEGKRKAKRNTKIKVGYYNQDFKYRIKTYSDFTAQIIQHELDHLEGIII